MLVIDSREKKGSKLVELVESEALKMKIPYEKKWIEMAQKIFELDPEFYISVMKNTDGNFIKNYKGKRAF